MGTLKTDCPCGSALPYASCCGRFHAGALHLLAPTAEALMRSRYSAYTLELDGYVLDTWHATTRPTTPFHHEPGLRWLGLQVIRHEGLGADQAVVEFVARSKLGGKAHRLREVSRFVREEGRWLYVEAIGE